MTGRSEGQAIADAIVPVHDPAFREAMARLAATVHIVTTAYAGQRHGMTMTAICSLSLDPLSIVLCVNRSAASHDALRAAGALSVNMLGKGQAGMAARFSGALGYRREARFDGAEWQDNPGYGPMLTSALARLDCRIALVEPFGTHSILACHVDRVVLGLARPALIYADRRYATVATEDA
ncbi:flavin reductase family protein [Sphingomonas aestuarii]